jgi:hypothetical protein
MKAVFKSVAYQRLLAVVALVFFPLALHAASKEEIDINVEEALAAFYAESPAGKRLAERAAGEISSNSAQEPIIGFIFSNKGLMYKHTFEGSKMTRLDR